VAAPATAASITGWNTGNVLVGATPDPGITGYSVIYNGDPGNPASSPTGRIAFTPPEAIGPGIKVQPEIYTQGGPGGITLSGCLMTSNPGATCTSPFQSGKRIKQQMTGLSPVDLVFDAANTLDNTGAPTTSTYQVFHRLINLTGQGVGGFSIELGSGVGDSFVPAPSGGGVTISPDFKAQPDGSGAVSTQFPFGLFGDATDNPNFSLDGFFASERTGMTVAVTDTTIESTGFFGPYAGLFTTWLSQEAVPAGAFWDNDNDASTDALLMAWLNPDGQWEVRREVADLGLGTAATLLVPETYATYDEVVTSLGLDGVLSQGPIEDLANLNVNFAVRLGDLGGATSFTLRTTMLAAEATAVPAPPAAPLMALAIGALALVRRRRA
jgi:hypothetical protein